jgi:hypothetical protein
MERDRGDLYAEVATHRIDTADRSPEAIVDEILRLLGAAA